MFNPKYKGDVQLLKGDEKNVLLDTEILFWKMSGETAVMVHKYAAFLLFVFMYIITGFVVFSVLIGTERYGVGLLIFILMSVLLLSLVISAWKPGWCQKTSLVEYIYCILFGLVPSLITNAQIVP
jgi:hypothetical protein